MLSIKKMYNYIRKNGTRKQNLELDLILDTMHDMVADIGSNSPKQRIRPRTLQELIQQSKGGG